jgi:pilus assembly protein CpaF
MFSIIISEKGGAERRESFDKAEITVGRVQGNDIVLPKGNVSKQHARLLFRDGRFIVTDLKSTNGTYVNGRKIAQATVVREGDKVYVGDFVIRVDGGSEAMDEAPIQGEQEVPTMNRDNPMKPVATFNPPSPQALHGPQGMFVGDPQVGGMQAVPPAIQHPSQPFQGGNIPNHAGSGSAFPAPIATIAPPYNPPAPLQRPNQVRQPSIPPQAGLGQNAAALPLGMPPLPDFTERPGPLPSHGGLRAATLPLEQKPRASVPPPAIIQPVVAQPSASASAQLAPPIVLERKEPAQQAPQRTRSEATATPGEERPVKEGAPAGRRLALLSLMNRVGTIVDMTQLALKMDAKEAQRLERIVRDQLAQMRTAGEIPPGLEVDTLAHDAMAEISALGPLTKLLADDQVIEIHGVKADQVLVRRRGNQASYVELESYELAFSSEWAVRRAISRMSLEGASDDIEGDVLIERRLQNGAVLKALMPPVAGVTTFSIIKKQTFERTLQDLVRVTAMSKPMAEFLEQAISAKVAILVTGHSHLVDLVSALSSQCRNGERVAVLHDAEELALHQCYVTSLSVDSASIWASLRMRFDRLFVLSSAFGTASAVTEVISAGQRGVVACVSSESLEEALQRVAVQWLDNHSGATLATAKECASSAFSVGIEVATDDRGNLRVDRISEFAQNGTVVDVFKFVEGAPDGGFSASGHIPRWLRKAGASGLN